jgi:rRNA maturation endonuclease Nob1
MEQNFGGNAMAIDPYITRLEQQLQAIESQVVQFLNDSTIEKRYKDPFEEEEIIFIANDYYWGEDDESQKRQQLKLLQLYSSWLEHLQLIFQNASKETRKQISDTHQNMMKWIEKENGWNVPSTIGEAKSNFKKVIQTYYQLLQIFKNSHKTEIILVPDTNALIKCADLSRYADVAGLGTFTVVFIPTVLSELDKLKRDHRDQDFRNKVDKVIRYIKGLRQQGNIREGVIVHKTITVKMIAQDPNFEKTLGWLNPTNADDRIIASTLEIQQSEPSNTVILVTSDINHQNKAEMANLPYAEPPKLPESPES